MVAEPVGTFYIVPNADNMRRQFGDDLISHIETVCRRGVREAKASRKDEQEGTKLVSKDARNLLEGTQTVVQRLSVIAACTGVPEPLEKFLMAALVRLSAAHSEVSLIGDLDDDEYDDFYPTDGRPPLAHPWEQTDDVLKHPWPPELRVRRG